MNQQPDLSPAEVYERYLSRAIADPWTRVLLELALPKPGERVLDIACGTGSVARQVAPMVGISGQVLALDINSEMLEVGRAQPSPAGASILWQEGDATRLELPGDAFDLVLCQQGFQFFPDRVASGREMRRVLRDGGRAVISVWQSLSRHPLYEELFTATARVLDAPISDVDVAFSLSNPEELYTLLSEAGFHYIEITPRSLFIRMPEPERFVQFSILGAATSVPAFASMDAIERFALVEKVRAKTHAIIQGFRDGDSLAFSMETNIAIAK
ncbi:class I SAM-dependent methyltransferase [Pollutimonas sp. H1-120]|uniref:class I SAM-dependent methyltransferase n=1 Tax=Pollutimonas sp. H1-120 TaxID=3148824 RepID=UPI003B51AD44